MQAFFGAKASSVRFLVQIPGSAAKIIMSSQRANRSLRLCAPLPGVNGPAGEARFTHYHGNPATRADFEQRMIAGEPSHGVARSMI